MASSPSLNSDETYSFSRTQSQVETSTLSSLSQRDNIESFKSCIKIDKIACIGAGYVGGPTMAMIAKKCPHLQVYVGDVSHERINQWNSNDLPIYEPGLNDLISECRGKNLYFTTELSTIIRDCDIIFISVNTSTKTFGTGQNKALDLSAWELAARSVATYAESSKIIIEKSTVPVRAAENLQRILKTNAFHKEHRFLLLSNPEFLAEGTAVYNLECPDRVLIGYDENDSLGEFAFEVLASIYRHWIPNNRILRASVWSSELTKLVSNSFLAQRITSINTISMLCEKTGADIRQGVLKMALKISNTINVLLFSVAEAVGSDSRIGLKYLNASVGFGGSCLQKDILSLVYLLEYYGLYEIAQYWHMVKEMNDFQKKNFALKIIEKLFHTVYKKKIAVFGFAFKKNTADTRMTPAADVCAFLMTDGALIHVYDPQVKEEAARQAITTGSQFNKFDLNSQFFLESTPQAAVQGAHAIVILTEWDVFKTYDYSYFYELMLKPAFIFDGRNILDHSCLTQIGFEVHGIGVQCPNKDHNDPNKT